MNGLINRLQINILDKYLKKFPVIAVLRARQVGKTTLDRDLLNVSDFSQRALLLR
jgi:hypothetical protein